jgi:WD40 repeat protein
MRLRGHTGIVQSVCFSPNGKTLASGSDDNMIKLWDVVLVTK